MRVADNEVFNKSTSLVTACGDGVASKIDYIRPLLKEHETTASIFKSHREGSSSSRVSNSGPNVVLDFGSQAECVTFDEAFERRKEKLSIYQEET